MYLGRNRTVLPSSCNDLAGSHLNDLRLAGLDDEPASTHKSSGLERLQVARACLSSPCPLVSVYSAPSCCAGRFKSYFERNVRN